MTDCKKRERKKDTLCVNNHGHQTCAELKPGRPMSLVKSGKIEWICYKSSHFEIQRLTLYFESGSDRNDFKYCRPAMACTHLGGLSTEYPAQISAWDSSWILWIDQSLTSVPTHLQSRQECCLKWYEMWSPELKLYTFSNKNNYWRKVE